MAEKNEVNLREERLFMRLLASEKEAFQNAAELSGLALSAWARQRLRQAAIKELEPANIPIAFLENLKVK